MSAINIIKDYLEDNLSAKAFQKEVYYNRDVEILLSENIDIPPYTNGGNAYIYLLEIDLLSPSGEINGKDLLSSFLRIKGVGFNINNKHEEIYDILHKVIPSWISIDDNYSRYLIEKYKDNEGRELQELLKREINSSFKFLKKKPKWLQSPNWPIKNDRPLCFVGQIDISNLKHDTSFLYVFFDSESNEYITFEQSM